MSVRRGEDVRALQRELPDDAGAVAWLALRESRLRGLAAAEEYRVIADRLYRAGFRDLPSGALLAWIESTVAECYEELLALRSLGDRLNRAIAAGDLAQAAWIAASDLEDDALRRLIAGLQRLARPTAGDAIERETGATS
jgi:hypothetical protein